MGVPTFKFKLWAFAMGAAVGGLSGALFASYQTVITPEQLHSAASRSCSSPRSCSAALATSPA